VTRPRLLARHAMIAILDTVMLIAFLALMEPGGSTGFVWHEWVGVAVIPLFVVHVIISWAWITATLRRLRDGTDVRARMNFLLNAALFLMMLVVLVSGLVISDYVLPKVGTAAGGSDRWQRLHNGTSSLILPVVGLHVALNWTWIKGAFRRYLVSSQRRRTDPVETET
jgi:cytochrome b561